MAPTLTAREVEILTIAFQCFKDPEAIEVSPNISNSRHAALPDTGTT